MKEEENKEELPIYKAVKLYFSNPLNKLPPQILDFFFQGYPFVTQPRIYRDGISQAGYVCMYVCIVYWQFHVPPRAAAAHT